MGKRGDFNTDTVIIMINGSNVGSTTLSSADSLAHRTAANMGLGRYKVDYIDAETGNRRGGYSS